VLKVECRACLGRDLSQKRGGAIMRKFVIVALGLGFTISAGAIDAVLWTKSKADRNGAAVATARMPSIAEFHAKSRAQNLPDLTVKEPY
jgi:hypothetical protein